MKCRRVPPSALTHGRPRVRAGIDIAKGLERVRGRNHEGRMARSLPARRVRAAARNVPS
jgi:hypothetical protein